MSDFFADIPQIKYEGPDSSNELAYRYYDKSKVELGKTMEEHMRFAACFWHTCCWPGSDVFGGGTFNRPWHAGANDSAAAAHKREVAFDFFNSSISQVTWALPRKAVSALSSVWRLAVLGPR